MKAIGALIAVPAISVAYGGFVGAIILAALVGVICLVFAALSYLLITRLGVAPRVELGKGKLRIWFERLWPSSSDS